MTPTEGAHRWHSSASAEAPRDRRARASYVDEAWLERWPDDFDRSRPSSRRAGRAVAAPGASGLPGACRGRAAHLGVRRRPPATPSSPPAGDSEPRRPTDPATPTLLGDRTHDRIPDPALSPDHREPRIWFVPGTTPFAGTSAALTGGTAKDITFSLTPTGWRPAITENSISDGRMRSGRSSTSRATSLRRSRCSTSTAPRRSTSRTSPSSRAPRLHRRPRLGRERDRPGRRAEGRRLHVKAGSSGRTRPRRTPCRRRRRRST
jgi:hypothetical protein